jgi:hypothetical protein
MDDYAMLRRIELSELIGPRWRHIGSTPSPEVWMQALHQGVLVAYVVCNRRMEPLGLVSCYNANPFDRYAYLAAMKFDPVRPSPKFLGGAILFIDYLFRSWQFRKIYIETLEYNLAQYGSGLQRSLKVESCLRSHHYYDGTWWDEYTLALYREDWSTRRQSYTPFLTD